MRKEDTIFIVSLNSKELKSKNPTDRCFELAKVIATKFSDYDVSVITKDIDTISHQDYKELFKSKINS